MLQPLTTNGMNTILEIKGPLCTCTPCILQCKFTCILQFDPQDFQSVQNLWKVDLLLWYKIRPKSSQIDQLKQKELYIMIFQTNSNIKKFT